MTSESHLRIAGQAALGLVVFATCYAAARYFEGDAGIAAVWPANALVLAFQLRACPTRLCSRMALVTAFAAMVAANLAVGRPLAASVIFPFANVVEIALAAWFMRRITLPLAELKDLRQFLLGAVTAGPLASTLIATAFMAGWLGLRGGALLEQASGWLLADMTGMAIVAPFALSLGSFRPKGGVSRLAGPVVVGGVTFLLCWQNQLPVLFLAFPLVALAVLQDRDRGGALGVGAITVAILGAATLGQGPIARLQDFGLDAVVITQVFLGALVLTAYPLSTVLKRLDVLTAELDERRAVAESASAAKSELIGRVGEDLRSPLTGVVTVAEILRSGRLGDLNARQRDLLARIAESGAEIETLSREMVALADGGSLSGRSTAVADIVREAVGAARFRARRAGVGMDILPGESAWRAGIDADRLRRLVGDALTGALEAAPAGSSVRIIAGLEGEDRIEVVIEDAGAASLAERLTRFRDAAGNVSASDEIAFDLMDLRRIGGDLRFGAGALGGGRLCLILPRLVDAKNRVAA